MGVTRDVMRMFKQGLIPRAIGAAVAAQYADQIDAATPTPYPPA
jgi:hypothetical protein